MTIKKYLKKIIKELEAVSISIPEDKSNKLVDEIITANKIFVAGVGRSGFAVKSFAMRLMHMGFNVYAVGETITPNIEKGDLLIIGSGSGETDSLIAIANKARCIKADIALVTIFPKSTIAKLSDIVINILASTPKVKKDNQGFSSIQPMGTLFEQSLLLYLDSLILVIMNKKGIDSDKMFLRHANLE